METESKTATRIYKVTSQIPGMPEEVKLVDAISIAKALTHVAKKSFQVKVASAKETAHLLGKSVKLETA